MKSLFLSKYSLTAWLGPEINVLLSVGERCIIKVG